MRRPIGLVLAMLIAAGVAFWMVWQRAGTRGPACIQLNGVVEGEPYQVASRHDGVIAELLVHVGDPVAKGQVVARIENPGARTRVDQARQAVAALESRIRSDRASLAMRQARVPLEIRAADAAVEHAQAVLEQAEAEESQLQELLDQARAAEDEDASKRPEREEAELALTAAQRTTLIARTALQQARNDVELAHLGEQEIASRIAEVDALEADRSKAQKALDESGKGLLDLGVSAERAGTIMACSVRVGEDVSVGGTIFEIVDLDSLHVIAGIGEEPLRRLRAGQPARVYLKSLPDRPFDAVVGAFAAGSVKLLISSNPNHVLVPGAEVAAVIKTREDAPWVDPRW